MKTFKTILAILLIFAVGALSGITVTQYHYQKRFEQTLTQERPNRRQHLLRRLEKELDLTDSQHSTIEQLLQQSHKQLRELRLRHRPRIKEIMEESMARVRKELDPQQQTKFDSILKRMRDRRAGDLPPRRFDQHGRRKSR